MSTINDVQQHILNESTSYLLTDINQCQLNDLNESVSCLQASSASHFRNAEKFTS